MKLGTEYEGKDDNIDDFKDEILGLVEELSTV